MTTVQIIDTAVEEAGCLRAMDAIGRELMMASMTLKGKSVSN